MNGRLMSHLMSPAPQEASVVPYAGPAPNAGRVRPLRRYAPAVRRFIVIAAIAWWLGGFTFYSGVAIPMGVQVLGGHRTVGVITESVTNWREVAELVTR